MCRLHGSNAVTSYLVDPTDPRIHLHCLEDVDYQAEIDHAEDDLSEVWMFFCAEACFVFGKFLGFCVDQRVSRGFQTKMRHTHDAAEWQKHREIKGTFQAM